MSHTSSGSGKDAAIDFVAGSLGGVALVYVGQPLDTVKVKMQAFPQLYRGMTSCLLETLRTEGVLRGLYAGTLPAVVANVAENSVLFAAYGACQKLMLSVSHAKEVAELSPLANASAGFLAAFFSSFTLCPTELIKCQLQAQRETSTQHAVRVGPFQLTRRILQREGIPGLFRGLTSTLAREMPGYFFFFGGYEATRQLLTPHGKSKHEIGAIATMASGAVGGMLFWTAIFPADVVKSRIQIQHCETSLFSMIVNIFRTEGILALYSGLQPTLVRTIPATAMLFLVYEYSKKLLHNVFD
ncbi:mitochondrial ornithine transporter 1 [Bacillus rossius redtenbacheri]|uniref:mitochondrial ornithine transporter 1 n=1 Tax=Bacillus rossius redtenbacheri TaxID=93214 RepID=UPI002FDE4449